MFRQTIGCRMDVVQRQAMTVVFWKTTVLLTASCYGCVLLHVSQEMRTAVRYVAQTRIAACMARRRAMSPAVSALSD
jgi:hypothetical protein